VPAEWVSRTWVDGLSPRLAGSNEVEAPGIQPGSVHPHAHPSSIFLVDAGPRRIIAVERAVALQASAQEPRAWTEDGRFRRTAVALPFVARLSGSEGQGFVAREGAKPGRRGAGVDEARDDTVAAGAGCGGVFAGVEQDITQGELDRSRSGERAGVVAVGEEPALALELAIDGAGDADREALNASREGSAVLGFGDEMEVVALDGELDEGEAEAAFAVGEGLAHGAEEGSVAQGAHAALYAQGDVEGVVAGLRRATQVGCAGALAVGRAACALAGSAPSAKAEAELARASGHELELALNTSRAQWRSDRQSGAI
jgi:hypothetical protein